LNEDDILAIPINWYKDYGESSAYHADLEAWSAPKRPSSALADGVMTLQESCRSMEHDKTLYTDL
jgi:hypothetical protein